MELVAEAKQELRRAMRRARSSITDRHRRTSRLWADVVQLCESLERRDHHPLTVMAFVGVGNEPDTAELIDLLLAAGHRVLLPRVEGEHIVASPYVDRCGLRSGAYGIPEPTGPAVEPDTIDLMIVPGLAFTASGLRLGQGGGFYDRYLSRVRADCMTCGVGFAEQVVDEIPVVPHDRALTLLITS